MWQIFFIFILAGNLSGNEECSSPDKNPCPYEILYLIFPFWILTRAWLTAVASGLKIQSGSLRDPTFAIMPYFVHSHKLTDFPIIGLISRIGLHS